MIATSASCVGRSHMIFVNLANVKAFAGLHAKRMLSGPQRNSSEFSVCRFVYFALKDPICV
jgi:hypothetical protein